MLTMLGILLLVAGAILTFAVDRQAEGVDLQAVGWILMGGGGLSLFAAAVRAAGFAPGSSTPHPSAAPPEPVGDGRDGGRRRDDGRLVVPSRRAVEDRRAA